MQKTVFLTGATGNLGSVLALEILKNEPNTRLIVLVRGTSCFDAELRLSNILKTLSPEISWSVIRKRLTIITGDITEKRLGLSDYQYAFLANEITDIIHAAAATKFSSTLEEARLINYCGTENVMKLAQRAYDNGILRNFAYISTAYVCGDRQGEIFEDDTNYQHGFSNNYEQSKWEAEKLVRRLMPPRLLTILRPSIIVGDSVNGRITTFNVLYPILKLISRGTITVLPGRPDVDLDIIPVDYAARAILHILSLGEITSGKTFHIVAGRRNMRTTGEIVRKALDHFAGGNPGNNFDGFGSNISEPVWNRSILSLAENRITKLLNIYGPHLNLRRYFDNHNTIEALRDSDIIFPPLFSYFNKILEYSLKTDWGKIKKSAA